MVVTIALNVVASLSALYVLSYRKRGLRHTIITGLFTKVGTGVQPKPLDCMLFFPMLAAMCKVIGTAVIVSNLAETSMWLVIGFDQLYLILLLVGYSSYLAGVLYAMPITRSKGIHAVYEPDSTVLSEPLPAISVLYPSAYQRNVFLVVSTLYPIILCAGPAIASGVLYDQGYHDGSKVLAMTQYLCWCIIFLAESLIFFYYVFKQARILRANIVSAETELKIDQKTFGLKNLVSRSPARFLHIMMLLTGLGGGLILFVAGVLCGIWALCRDMILAMPVSWVAHTLNVVSSCAIPVLCVAKASLICAQSRRSRKRGLDRFSTPSTVPSTTKESIRVLSGPIQVKRMPQRGVFDQRALSWMEQVDPYVPTLDSKDSSNSSSGELIAIGDHAAAVSTSSTWAGSKSIPQASTNEIPQAPTNEGGADRGTDSSTESLILNDIRMSAFGGYDAGPTNVMTTPRRFPSLSAVGKQWLTSKPAATAKTTPNVLGNPPPPTGTSMATLRLEGIQPRTQQQEQQRLERSLLLRQFQEQTRLKLETLYHPQDPSIRQP